jgi:type IV pilus assembly protein PilN
MRTNINLATQPYEDVRSFATRWSVLLLLLALATAGAIYFTYTGWRAAQTYTKDIERENAEMARMDREIAGANAILNQPQNRVIREQSAFLNELIARKAFSWTRVFSDLERLMPPRLHVISIVPELDEQNQLKLKMSVAGDRDRMLELLHRMEGSKEFQKPVLDSESHEQKGLQFQISAIYVPLTATPRQPEGE